jgi:hypothetical protein
MSNIHITIFDEKSGNLMLTVNLKGEKGKMSFQPKKAGQYKICSNLNTVSSTQVIMGLKIHSDNMDEPKLHLAITRDQVAGLNTKVVEILNEGHAYLQHQETELDEEDDGSKMQLASSRNYYVLTIIQVVIIIGLGLYQIFSFRKFLALNHAI